MRHGRIDAKQATSKRKSLDITNATIDFIKSWEGFSATAYYDVSRWSVGYGTVGYEGEVVTEEEAAKRLQEVVATYSPENLPLSQPQVRPPAYYRRPIILVWVGLVKLLSRVIQASLEMLQECLDSTITLEVSNSQLSPDEEKPKQDYYGNPDLWWWIMK